MEQVLAASKSTLIGSLDFSGNPPVADYVQSRQQIQVFPQGSNVYAPGGVQQLRFSITTNGPFVDMSSLALQAKVKNLDAANPLTFLGPSLGTCIQEMRIYMGNVEVERTTFQNRNEALLHRFLPTEKRGQLYSEGFGGIAGTHAGNDFVAASIAAGASKTVVWRPCTSGVMNQRSYVPTAFISGGGCVVELLLVNSTAEVCDSGANKSTTWEWSDAKLLVDVVNVDSSFLTSLSKHLLGGGALTLNPQQYTTTMFAITSTDSLLQHARALTRLNSVFVTFYRDQGSATKKLVNCFYISPTGQELSLQMQVGAKIIPDHRTDNLSQHFHRLLHTLGLANSSQTFNITQQTYALDSFCAAIDCESVPGQAHGSGLSTHQSPLHLDFRGLGDADLPTSAYVTCFHESLITIESDGVSYAI